MIFGAQCSLPTACNIKPRKNYSPQLSAIRLWYCLLELDHELQEVAFVACFVRWIDENRAGSGTQKQRKSSHTTGTFVSNNPAWLRACISPPSH